METSLNQMKDESIWLFDTMCFHYGSEDVVALRRRFINFEHFFNQKFYPELTAIIYKTGSIVEGFRMGKTDRDFLHEWKDIHVETRSESLDLSSSVVLEMCPDPSGFLSEGYVLLKIKRITGENSAAFASCIKDALDFKTNIVSSSKFKEMFLSRRAPLEMPDLFLHGPCISTSGIYSDEDTANAFKCPVWPPQAEEWKTRKRVWPNDILIHNIVKKGCHLVPIGPNSNSRELWRLSFNTAEKMLVHSLTHTQLICYALLKRFYKEFIKKHPLYPQDSICSYYLKTLTFWIVQDTHSKLWEIHNLFPCFCLCFVRLIMWVKDRNCPNFFIPQRNMFRFKLCLEKRENLLRVLTTIYKDGLWKNLISCIPPIPVSNIPSMQYMSDATLFREIRILLNGLLANRVSYKYLDSSWNDYVKDTRGMSPEELELNMNVLLQESFLTQIGMDYGKDQELVEAILNSVHLTLVQKMGIYSKNKSCRLSAFIISENLDLTRGRTYLANFYYVENDFQQVIDVTNEILRNLSVCTMYVGINDVKIRDEGWKLYDKQITSKHLTWTNICKQFVAFDIILIKQFDDNDPTCLDLSFVPKELHFDMVFQRILMVIPSLVYVHFLRFMSFMRQQQFDQCRKSLQNMIQSMVDVCLHDDLGMAYLLIGICFEQGNCYQDAIYCYMRSYRFRSMYSSAVYRTCILVWKLLQ